MNAESKTALASYLSRVAGTNDPASKMLAAMVHEDDLAEKTAGRYGHDWVARLPIDGEDVIIMHNGAETRVMTRTNAEGSDEWTAAVEQLNA